MRVRSLLTALGLNAIPAVGWFVGEWSAGTTLVLYWLETLLGTFLVAGRIVLHRRIRPSKGHWDYRAPQRPSAETGSRSSYLSAFLVPAIAFTFVHGVFLVALGGLMVSKKLSSETRIEGHDLLFGLTGILVFQGFDFLFDLVWLRARSFAWIERQGQETLSRVIVIHLTIIGGMAAVMFTGANRHFFGVFIFLKTMLNCSLVLPQYNPETPPAWLSNILERIKPPKSEGTTFAQLWKQTDKQEAARIVRNEEPMERNGKPQSKD